MFRCEKPAGEGEAVGFGTCGKRGEEGGYARAEELFGLSEFAAVVEVGGTWVVGGAFAEDKGCLSFGEGVAKVVDLFAGHLGFGGGVEKALEEELRFVGGA